MIAGDKRPRLSKPPLREALIDIRLRNDLPAEFVDAVRRIALPNFSPSGEVKVGGVHLEIGAGKPSNVRLTSDDVVGVRLQSTDSSKVIQLRRNGITFSVLKNYSTWDSFQDEARSLWRQFLRIAGDVVVARLGIRYVNVIETPMTVDFDAYLTAAPRIPKELPQFYSGFFQRVVVPFEKERASAIITQALEQATEGSLSTVLDIDVSANCSFAGDAAEIWDRFSALREIKNRAFFASVTPKTLEAYE